MFLIFVEQLVGVLNAAWTNNVEASIKLVTGKGEEMIITPEDFVTFWKRAKENTSSSMSSLHFGHYKAAAHSEQINKILAQQITVICHSGIPSEWWSIGLQLMLEKLRVCAWPKSWGPFSYKKQTSTLRTCTIDTEMKILNHIVISTTIEVSMQFAFSGLLSFFVWSCFVCIDIQDRWGHLKV